LSPQYGESDAIRFLIGTQSLKPDSNQVHVVELEEDTGALHTKVLNNFIILYGEELDGPAFNALRRAIEEVKQHWSVIGWVTKKLLS
jgi:hypothetical protein